MPSSPAGISLRFARGFIPAQFPEQEQPRALLPAPCEGSNLLPSCDEHPVKPPTRPALVQTFLFCSPSQLRAGFALWRRGREGSTAVLSLELRPGDRESCRGRNITDCTELHTRPKSNNEKWTPKRTRDPPPAPPQPGSPNPDMLDG